MPAGIGALLREARDARGSSIEEIAWQLRIRPDVLRALEDENFADLGHPGFVRTHLRSYAKALGLDASELTRAYRRAHEQPQAPSSIAELHEKDRAARKHHPRSRWMVAACLASALLVAASVVGFLRGPGEKSGVAATTFPAGPRVSFEQASRALRPLQDAESITLRVASVKAVWVRVVVDGKRTFEGLLAPGASRLFTGTKGIELDVDDTAALTIWANDAKFTPPASGAWRGVFGRFGLVSG